MPEEPNFAAGRKLEFSLKDHLGSTSAVHDESGEVQKSRGQQPTDERHSYDAWGARRDNASWAPAGPMLGHSPPPTANSSPPTEPKVASSQPRGYTGHEMLDDVGLVHMNGRLYDAALGRFCSADPIIQEGENSQNYNRYTYVLNNPLSHTDPSGYSFWKKFVRALVAIIVAIIIVIVVIYTFGAALSALGAGQFLAGAGIYGTGAGFTLGVGNAVWMGAALGAVWAGVNAVIQGASFSQTLRAALNGAISGAVGAMIGGGLHELGVAAKGFGGKAIHAVAHGVAGGGMSEANGGSFKDGFIGSLIGAGVNTVAGGLFGDFDLYNPDSSAYGSIGYIAARTAIAAAAGGGASVLAGGKFADGAYSAAFFHLFNGERTNLLNLLKSSDVSYNYAQNYNPKGLYVVAAHGSSIAVGDYTNGTRVDLNADTLYDRMIKNGYKRGTPIVLMSCCVGSGEAQLMKRLAYLANAPVGGPSTSYWTRPEGVIAEYDTVKVAIPLTNPVRYTFIQQISSPIRYGVMMWFAPNGTRLIQQGYEPNGRHKKNLPAHVVKLPSELPKFQN